jgi:hypothetical protein
VWRRAAAAGLVLAVVVTVGLLGVGPAAAAPELTVSPASGPPGTEFVVSGSGFAALPVEIRWGGLSGPVIATATGPAFSVPAVVPESLPNSVPVMAVVTDGSSVSTSSASFQVTGTDAPPAPEETTTTTSTTVAVAETPATTPAPTPATPVPVANPPANRGGTGLTGGVDGGVDPDMAGTTNGGGASTVGAAPASPAGSGSGSGAGATTPTSPASTVPGAGADPGNPIVTPGPAPAGEVGALPAGNQVAAPAPPGSDAGEAAAPIAPARTSQSAGAVSNPALLVLGLGLVFGGGVFLAVRNRQRA